LNYRDRWLVQVIRLVELIRVNYKDYILERD